MTDTVITGAGGLLGSNLAAGFAEKGFSVAPLERAAGGPDITDAEVMEALLRDLAREQLLQRRLQVPAHPWHPVRPREIGRDQIPGVI